ncbi:MAG TPA: biotin/lipoate A/B protein ligase family protein [Ktedonobacterales bacterium]|nr:biotin/lipoate A/B protein ligase family protein [Ktedonobacterales bacterium]
MGLALPEYAPAEWRLIIEDEPHSGAWNMALDEAIMDAVGAGDAPPTLRLYQWAPPCLSLGKRQPLSGVDLSRCREDHIDVVRRATGGWAILHTDELTYSIATRPDDPRAEGAILDAYRRLSAGLIAGLHLLDVPAVMNPVDPIGVHNASAACFEVPSAYEITVGTQKLIGSAQTRPSGRVLQHGSLPLQGDIARLVRYLWFQTEDDREALAEHLRERAVTLSALRRRDVSFAEVADAMTRGFSAALRISLVSGTPTTAELAAAERVAREKEQALATA